MIFGRFLYFGLCCCLGEIDFNAVYFDFKRGWGYLCRYGRTKGRNGKFGQPVRCGDVLRRFVGAGMFCECSRITT